MPPTLPPAALPSGSVPECPPGAPHQAVWAALEAVVDPEIPVVNLREMGILRAVRQGPAGLEVCLTPTYSGCPAMERMADDVSAALRSAGLRAQVRIVLAPAWSTDWISPAGREKMRRWGIAPPSPVAASTADGWQRIQIATKNEAINAHPTVECPRCGSANTALVSAYGSTACKALYRCLACAEPFDHFKPY